MREVESRIYYPKLGRVRERTIFNYFPNYVLGKWYWLNRTRITEIYTKDSHVTMCNCTDEVVEITNGWVPTSIEIIK